MDQTVHRVELRVKFGDTDCTGRVYFTTYARWIDDTVVEFFRAGGATFTADGSINLIGRTLSGTFVLGEYQCRIEAPSKFDDPVVVEVGPKEVRDRVAIFEGRITDASNGKLLARGQISYVYVDKRTGRSSEIPADLLRLVKESR